MPRTIVYQDPAPGGGGARAAAPATAPSRDDLLARIAKYVPAEMITFATLGFAAFPPDGSTVWVVVAVGALLNAVYLLGTALGTSTARPPWFFYLLSAVAFVGWALVTIDVVREKAGLTGDDATTKQGFILLATAIFIPLVDTFLSRVFLGRTEPGG